YQEQLKTGLDPARILQSGLSCSCPPQSQRDFSPQPKVAACCYLGSAITPASNPNGVEAFALSMNNALCSRNTRWNSINVFCELVHPVFSRSAATLSGLIDLE
ncbi:MAG: hypothetical protein WCO19_05445, partial [Candidatus Saccharibacteria bacterium]